VEGEKILRIFRGDSHLLCMKARLYLLMGIFWGDRHLLWGDRHLLCMKARLYLLIANEPFDRPRGAAFDGLRKTWADTLMFFGAGNRNRKKKPLSSIRAIAALRNDISDYRI